MKTLIVGLLVGGGIVLVGAQIAYRPDSAFAQTSAPYPRGATSELIALNTTAEGHQQLTIIDPRARVIGVYHIDSARGEIALKSVRNIHWDLQLTEFNSAAPLPREISSLLQKR